MPAYTAPLDDIRFVLRDVLGVEALSALPGYEDATPDTIDSIIEEGAKLCEQVLFPLNQSGDAQGCQFAEGAVRTPAGFPEAYTAFCEGGWSSICADPAYGGMGLPVLVNTVMQEMICAANFSFGMYPGLSQGAYEALHAFGTDEQKALYLPKLASGLWTGTMCLTEAHCGTDLGLIQARAAAGPDGSFAITGTKIFISAGEHDLAENIVHLVLARLPDAPEGVKGISLFVVPKFLPDEAGNPGARNAVECGSIEHKMGIKASSTCVMNFDGATGWLVGEPNKGLKAMFKMMNAARLGVAMQGLGIAEVARQNATIYARERLQMRAVSGVKFPDKPADPIIVHPDVRRMLLTMKAFTEGARALSLLVSMNLDISLRPPDEETRKSADDFVALMTPVLKAYQTDMGFDVASMAMQVYGGHGYIRETGVEQYARDARIAMIYEGTNGIQALDLVGRKMGQGYGRLLRSFFHAVSDFLSENQADPALADLLLPLGKSFAKLQQASGLIAQKGLKDPEEGAAAATDYLRMFALVAMGWMWARMAVAAREGLEADPARKDFYEAKTITARFFMERMLPETEFRFRALSSGAQNLTALRPECF
ncbi:MAG: acyl-CoA dehydrogenase C-terminal domain-containing protein [Rhodospirillales bacterium]|nr:acyl-CoA dehydrogenase C-terminal domain-containing protein [Rhodospirillales bacterium]